MWPPGFVTKGKLEHKLGMPYACPTGKTAWGTGFLELKPLTSAGLLGETHVDGVIIKCKQ